MARARNRPRYPKLKDTLAKLIEEAKAQGRRHTHAALARRADVARSAVYPWLSGERRPQPPQIDAIADYFSFGRVDERARIRAQLFDSVEETPDLSPAFNDPLTRALEGSGPIRVGFVEYDQPGIGKFVRDLLFAFLDFLDIEYVPSTVGFGEVTQMLEAGDLDLGCGHWLTPARLRSLRSISLPVAIGMNGLAYAPALQKLKHQDGAQSASEMTAVMHRLQGPYPVARRVLGIPQARIVDCYYDAKDFVRVYNEVFAEWKRDHAKPIPVILTDEVMCREIYKEVVSNHSNMPVLLWTSRKESADLYRDGRLLAAHPRYNMAVSVRRDRDTEWFSFLEDSWRIFLRGNVEFARRLCEELRTHFDQKIAEIASIRPQSETIWKKRCRRWLTPADELFGLHCGDIWQHIRMPRDTSNPS